MGLFGGGGGLGASIGGVIGGLIGQDQASGDRAKGQGYSEQAFQELLGLGLPPDLSKEIILQHFQEAGMLTPEMEQDIEQTYSKVAQMQTDPTGRNAQLQALQKLKGLSQTGLGAEDRAALNQVRDQVQRDLEGKRQQIMQNFQARGQGGSGAELISQLQAAQGSANQASMEGDRLAAMAQQRAREALMQSSNLGSDIRNQDYTESLNRARAEDALNQFNVQNQIAREQRNVASRNSAQMANLQNKQSIMNANVQMNNNELYRQNQAKRDYWNDQMTRAKLRSGAYGGMGDMYQQRGDAIAKREQDRYTALGGIVEKGAKAIATMGGSEMMPSGDEGTTTPSQMPQPQYDSYMDRKYKNIYGYAHGGEVGSEDEDIPDGNPIEADLDNEQNDVVPAMLSKGEVVLPNSVTQHPDAPQKAAEFVAKLKDPQINTVDELRKAQDARNADMDSAETMRLAGLLGSSFSGVKNDYLEGAADRLDKRSQLRPQDFLQQVEMLQRDPNSSASKGMVQLLKSVLPNVQLPENMSAYDIEKAAPFLKSVMPKSTNLQKGGVDQYGHMLVFNPRSGKLEVALDDQGQPIKAREEVFSTFDPKTGERIIIGRNAKPGAEGGVNVISKFGTPSNDVSKVNSNEDLYQGLDVEQRKRLKENQDGFLKDSQADRDAVGAAKGIATILQAGKQLGGDILRAVQTQFARAAGDKGALSEADVAPYGGLQDVKSRALRAISMSINGQLPDEDRKFLIGLAKIMEQKSNSYINKQAEVYTNNFAQTVPGLGPDKARQLLNVDATLSSPMKKEVSGEVKRKTEDGKIAIFDKKTKKFLRYEE